MSSQITIVMYHYVRPIQGSRYPGIKGLEYKLFEEQIDFLRKNYQIIRVEDVLEQLGKKQEASEALVALGYSASEAAGAIRGLELSEENSVEDILKQALKQMSFL